MNAKPLKQALIIACIPLFLAGCGEDTTPPEAVQAAQPPSATPTILPSILKVKRHSKTYVITGIGLSGSNKVAIINNQIVKPGMEVDPGVVLKDVQPTYAIIIVGDTQHLLRPEDIQRELDKKRKSSAP